MNLTENQLECLLPLFKHSYPGALTIATKLLVNGRCIVAGRDVIWKGGGIGKFITTKENEDLVDCLEYILDLERLISSAYFQEYLKSKFEDAIDELSKAKSKVSDLSLLVMNN